MSSVELPRCQRHPTSVAGWACQSCAAQLCPDCVATQALSLRTELDSCVLCGGTTRQLKAHRSRVSFWERIFPGALLFPLNVSGLMSLAAVGAVTAALGAFFWHAHPLFKPFCFFLWMGAFWASMFHIIRLTARGEHEITAPEYTETFSDLILPAVRGVVAASFLWIPAAWYIFKLSGYRLGAPPQMLAEDPWVWFFLLVGAAYVPMALIVGAAGGGLLRILNPVLVVGYILRIPKDYAVTVAVLLALGVMRGVIAIPAMFVAKAPIPLLSAWVSEIISLYVPFVMARILGLLLYVRGDALDYGMSEDYLEPLLNDEPRGSLTFAGSARRDIESPQHNAAASTSPATAAPATGIALTLEAVTKAVDANDVDRAVELYAAAPSFLPAQLPPAYHFAVGQGAATRGNYPLAVRALTAASETDPSDPIAPRAFVVLARVYGERMNDTRKANAIYQFVVERYPGTSAAQFALTRMAPAKA